MDRQERADGRVGVCELLEDPNAVEPGQSTSADVLGTVDGRHAQFGGLPQDIDRKWCVWSHSSANGAIFFGGEGRRGLGDDAGVFIEIGIESAVTVVLPCAGQSIVGMTNSAPSLMPEGQRVVTVLVLV